MISKIYIDNFKSLNDFTLECNKITCLIGMNSSGKSTILQAVDFLGAIASGNVKHWLGIRGWEAKEIKSKFQSKQLIKFEVDFTLDNSFYTWSGSLNLNIRTCSNEKIHKKIEKDGKSVLQVILKVDKGTCTIYQNLSSESVRSEINFDYEGSILGTLKDQSLGEELTTIKQFLQSIKSLELLNPLLLRKRARGSEEHLGLGGEKLSSFLYSLSSSKRKVIDEHIQQVFKPFEKCNIKAKRFGWKELWISEVFQNKSTVSTEAKHISDGFLRILALFSQLQTDYPVLLFDEIEDGLNQEVMEYLIDEMVKSPKQIFFTTHSPMLLNFFEDHVAEESIQLIYRDFETGKTSIRKFFEIPELKERLEYMGPGEVLANADLKELS
ncbi:MAG: putative ATPase [bacterium]|jgi:predicted ATPase